MGPERNVNNYRKSRGNTAKKPSKTRTFIEVVPPKKPLGRPRIHEPEPELIPVKTGRPVTSTFDRNENARVMGMTSKGQLRMQVHISAETKAKIFNENQVEIFNMFKNGATFKTIEAKFGVNGRTVNDWKKLYRDTVLFDENPEPTVIAAMKRRGVEGVENHFVGALVKSNTEINRQLGRMFGTIDDMRIKGLDIICMTMDRVKVLIDETDDVSKLAKVMSAVLPYVATKKGDKSPEEGSELSMDQKRAIFVQNVLNVYDTRSPEEQRFIDAATERSEAMRQTGHQLGLEDEDLDDLEDEDFEDGGEYDAEIDSDELL